MNMPPCNSKPSAMLALQRRASHRTGWRRLALTLGLAGTVSAAFLARGSDDGNDKAASSTGRVVLFEERFETNP